MFQEILSTIANFVINTPQTYFIIGGLSIICIVCIGTLTNIYIQFRKIEKDKREKKNNTISFIPNTNPITISVILNWLCKLTEENLIKWYMPKTEPFGYSSYHQYQTVIHGDHYYYITIEIIQMELKERELVLFSMEKGHPHGLGGYDIMRRMDITDNSTKIIQAIKDNNIRQALDSISTIIVD
jgi:hypothetical protein